MLFWQLLKQARSNARTSVLSATYDAAYPNTHHVADAYDAFTVSQAHALGAVLAAAEASAFQCMNKCIVGNIRYIIPKYTSRR
jgi:hypothetical protein